MKVKISEVFARFQDVLQRDAAGDDLNEAEREQAQEARSRLNAWHQVVRKGGERYARCTLDRFQRYHENQDAVLHRLGEFRDDLHQHLADGSGLVLFGPPGTGKDHLMMALLRDAVMGHGASADWVSCQDLFGDIRDAMDGDASERSLVRKLAAPKVLAISDPVPPFGDLTNHQATMLFRIIDARYRQLKGTWITINVAGSDEARQRVGHAVIDRLCHDALGLHCSWPSFRTAKGS